MEPVIRFNVAPRSPIEEFYNQCHDEKGRFCEGEDGPGRLRDNDPGSSIPLRRSVDKKGYSIARKYHKDPDNNADKQGKDYVAGHLTQVGTSLPPDLALAGWLHDTLEDTKATPESLARDGVDAETIRIIKAVSIDDPRLYPGGIKPPYPERIQKVIDEGGPKAVRVKLSDTHSNSDPFRPRGDLNPQKYLDATKQLENYLKKADAKLYQDYLDRIKNRPGAFDWDKVRNVGGRDNLE